MIPAAIAGMAAWFFGNIAQSSLTKTNAFEVFYDGSLVSGSSSLLVKWYLHVVKRGCKQYLLLTHPSVKRWHFHRLHVSSIMATPTSFPKTRLPLHLRQCKAQSDGMYCVGP